MAWMASEPGFNNPEGCIGQERTRLACMSCPNISLMWLRIRSWLNMAIICRVLAGQGWRSCLRTAPHLARIMGWLEHCRLSQSQPLKCQQNG